MPPQLAYIMVVKVPGSSAHIIVYIPSLLTGGHTMGLFTMTKENVSLYPRPDAGNTFVSVVWRSTNQGSQPTRMIDSFK